MHRRSRAPARTRTHTHSTARTHSASQEHTKLAICHGFGYLKMDCNCLVRWGSSSEPRCLARCVYNATKFHVPTFGHCRIIATRLAVLVTGVVSWRKISVLKLLYKCLPHTAIWKTVAPGIKPRLERHSSLQAVQSRYSVALTQIEHDLKNWQQKTRVRLSRSVYNVYFPRVAIIMDNGKTRVCQSGVHGMPKEGN